MDQKKELEEKLRESCCIGDEKNVKLLVERGVNINAANEMNGWRPLHWAAKRGHRGLVDYLVKQGVDIGARTSKGETAAQLSTDPNIKKMLGNIYKDETPMAKILPIEPNYLRNPEFFYAEKDKPYKTNESAHIDTKHTFAANDTNTEPRSKGDTGSVIQEDEEVVFKFRVANAEEKDFLEIDLDRKHLTYDNLLATSCRELCIDSCKVKKIRKLPNVIVRNDKDVKRLHPFQELELVLLGDTS